MMDRDRRAMKVWSFARGYGGNAPRWTVVAALTKKSEFYLCSTFQARLENQNLSKTKMRWIAGFGDGLSGCREEVS